MSLITKINDKNYNDNVMKTEKPFVLVFSSLTCPHCRTVETFLKKVQYDYEEINIYFIESEKSPKLLSKFQIRAFPTTIFFNEEKKSSGLIVGEGTLPEFFKNLDKLKKKKEEGGFFKKLFGKE